MYYVYILRNSQNKLYIGQTNNPELREKRHDYGIAARFTAQNKNNFRIVYIEEYTNRADAMEREQQLKKWTRPKKEALINSDIGLLKKL